MISVNHRLLKIVTYFVKFQTYLIFLPSVRYQSPWLPKQTFSD